MLDSRDVAYILVCKRNRVLALKYCEYYHDGLHLFYSLIEYVNSLSSALIVERLIIRVKILDQGSTLHNVKTKRLSTIVGLSIMLHAISQMANSMSK